MNVAIRYQSRGGNVREMAEILSEGAGVEAISVDDSRAPMSEPVDLLFIGGALYGFKLDPSLVEFIDSIPEGMVKRAICFGSSALTRRPVYLIQAALKQKGVQINPLAMYQRGKVRPYLREIGPKFARDEIEKYEKELAGEVDDRAPIVRLLDEREKQKDAKKAAARVDSSEPEADN